MQLAVRSISAYAYSECGAYDAYDAGFNPGAQAMVFDLATGKRIELMPALSPVAPKPEVPSPPPAGSGPRKLGVISRELTLLPHDWEGLNQQPGGAQVTLRKLDLTGKISAKVAARLSGSSSGIHTFPPAVNMRRSTNCWTTRVSRAAVARACCAWSMTHGELSNIT